MELEDLLDVNLKMAEMFYLTNKARNCDFVSNGLLIYHKNRLIDRAKPKLGTLLQ